MKTPPPGWTVQAEGTHYVAYNPRGGSLIAATAAEAIFLAGIVEDECQRSEAPTMNYRGWIIQQLEPGLWQGERQTKHGPHSVQESSQRALEARIDAILDLAREVAIHG